MNRYAYGFAWTDKEGIARKIYIEAPSQVEATQEFEKMTGIDVMLTLVYITRNRV